MSAAQVADSVTIAQLARAAAAQFVREARKGNDPMRYRLDLYRKVDVPDRAIASLERAHAVAVRISVICESMLFEEDAATTSVVIRPASLPSP